MTDVDGTSTLNCSEQSVPPDHTPTDGPADPRLPKTVVPLHYEIELCPDLGAATFTGSVVVDINIVETTDTIVCNAAELDIKSVELPPADFGHASTQPQHSDRPTPTNRSSPTDRSTLEKLEFAVDHDAERLTLSGGIRQTCSSPAQFGCTSHSRAS